MQLSSEINPYLLGANTGANVGGMLPVRGWRIAVALGLVVLAFVPLTASVDALEGGTSTRGILEFGLILAGLALLAIYLKAQGAFSFDLKSPAFLIVSAYCWWSMLSFIWSPSPVLTIAKSAELWCIALAALMVATIILRSNLGSEKLATLFALTLVAVIVGLILANIFYWGKPLPTTGDSSLMVEFMGEDISDERPRLILAYQHPLLTADLLAIAIISLAAADLRKIFKAILMPGLLALLWLVDARGATIGLAISLLALAVLRLRRNSERALMLMLGLCLGAAGLLVFQDRLPALVRPLVTDDLLTLNSRTELWSKTLTHIFAEPMLGTGYFASRFLLIKDFSWAGHAHNSFLEVQLTTGLIGLLMLCAFLVLVAKEIFATRNVLLVGVTLYCMIQGMVNPIFFTPGLAMFALTLALIHAELRKSSSGDLAS